MRYLLLFLVITLFTNCPFEGILYEKDQLIPETFSVQKKRMAMYMWSKHFNRFPNTTLISSLKSDSITTVFLSTGMQKDSLKLVQFLEEASQAGIKIVAMIGSSNLHLKDSSYIKQRIDKELAFGFYGIHLDVEPHMLPLWRLSENMHMRKLLESYYYIDMICKNADKTLSVSIPAIFPEYFYKGLSILNIPSYIMLYEIKKYTPLLKRINKLRPFLREGQINIALRTNDFQNNQTLTDIIDRLYTDTGIPNYCIHDADSWYTNNVILQTLVRDLTP